MSQENAKRHILATAEPARMRVELPHRLVTEIGRLFNMGYRLVPLGKGPDGRQPSTKFGGQKRVPKDVVLRRLADLGSQNYAVELDRFVVVDVDTDTPDAHAYVERRFGLSPFVVKSPKGVHYWYRIVGNNKPKVAAGNKIRDGVIAIDIKSGKNELIAGPYARRLDGGEYLPAGALLPPIDRLPVFVDKEPPAQIDLAGAVDRTKVGVRNDTLIKKAREFCGYVESQDELFQDLCALRNIEFDQPETMPDAHIMRIAAWAWGLRLAGKLSVPGKSTVKVSYDLTAKLMQIKNDGPNTLMFYHKLQHDHAAKRRWFALDSEKMAEAKIFPFGRDAIVKATRILVEEGVLERRTVPAGVTKGGLPKIRHEYRLTGKGEGFTDYIIPRIQNQGFSIIEGGMS